MIGTANAISECMNFFKNKLIFLSQLIGASINVEFIHKKEKGGNATGTKVTISLPSGLEIE